MTSPDGTDGDTGTRDTAAAATDRAGSRQRARRAAVVGVVAVAVTFAVAELVAALGRWWGFQGDAASPVGALATAVIDLAPGPVVEWAKTTLGAPGDKIVLGIGIVVVALLLGAVIGRLGLRSAAAALALAVVLGAVSAAAVLTRADSRFDDLLALLLGVLAGVGVLLAGWRAVGQLHPQPGSTLPQLPADAGRRRFVAVAGGGAVAAVAAAVLSRVVPSDRATVASREQVTLPALTPSATPSATTGGAPTGSGSAAPTTATSAPAVVGEFDDVPGMPSYVTPNDAFYRIDTAFDPPLLTTEGWSLKIHGLVDKPLELRWDDLVRRPQEAAMVTLTCVSNQVGGDLIGNALWQGVRIADVLREVGVQQGADCVLTTDAQGWTCSTPLEALTDDRDALFAIGMNGQPLPVEHGFPVRMVVPGLYGYVSATKWVTDLEVTKFSGVVAYWTDLGWSDHGPIKLSSRIDVPKDTASAGTVPIGGVAWHQHTGVRAVQVQIDPGTGYGEWLDAELSRPVSSDTWVQWRYPWQASPGTYRIRCRAIGADGAVQVEKEQPVLPDGATGYHDVQVTVTA